MHRRENRPSSWAPIVGRRAAAGLDWLERNAGPRAIHKFLGGKVRGTRFSGQYLLGISDQAAGRELISELLDLLQQGETIPLCDVVSYYAHGKRWPLGMAIHRGRLVDVWLPSGPTTTPPVATKDEHSDQ